MQRLRYKLKNLDVTNIIIPHKIDNPQGTRYTTGIVHQHCVITYMRKKSKCECIYVFKIKKTFCIPAPYINLYIKVTTMRNKVILN